MLHNSMYTKLHPDQFPVDATGKPTTDQIMTLVDIYVDPSKATGTFTLRDLGGAAFGGGGGGGGRAGGRRAAASAASGAGAAAGAAAGAGGSPGEGKFTMDVYLRERGDANIKTLTDLINKANWADDPAYNPRKPSMESADKAMVLDTATRMQRRFAVQQIILQAFADQKLDAVVYPTGNLPPSKLGQPTEPNANGRGQVWTFLGMQGFPAMTVPCGFTTEVYDRVPVDPKSWPVPRGEGAGGEYGGATVPTNLVGPIPAKLPVGVDFLGIPFSEPTLLKIAAAYESVSPHRMPPPDFGPLKEGSSAGVQ
jgi:hypothetical protein